MSIEKNKKKLKSKLLLVVFVVLLAIYVLFFLPESDSPKSVINPNADPIGSLIGLPDDLKRALNPADDFQPVPEPEPGDWLAQHDEPGQTYDQYAMSFPNRPDATRSKIYLQPLGPLSDKTQECLSLLLDYIKVYFQIEATVNPPLRVQDINIRTRFRPVMGCRQLHAIDILDQLKSRVPDDAFCVLALTGEDLYPEESWNYVFGYASFRERVGVYSFARYDPTFFGEPRPEHFHHLFLRRSLQILAHETAHMYGLKHCIHYHCAMNGSNNLPESDAQPLHLCPVCLRKLHFATGCNVVQRYSDLFDFYQKSGLKKEAEWIKDRLMWILVSKSNIISN